MLFSIFDKEKTPKVALVLTISRPAQANKYAIEPVEVVDEVECVIVAVLFKQVNEVTTAAAAGTICETVKPARVFECVRCLSKHLFQVFKVSGNSFAPSSLLHKLALKHCKKLHLAWSPCAVTVIRARTYCADPYPPPLVCSHDVSELGV